MTHIDWKQQVMKFQLGGSTICLQGDPSHGKTLMSIKAMSRPLKRECYGILVEFNNHESRPLEVSEAPI